MSFAARRLLLLGALSGGNSSSGVFVSQSGSSGDGTEANPYSPAEFKAALTGGEVSTGSIVKFNKGDRFDFDFTIDRALTLDAYGEGNNPIISGSDDVGGEVWTLDSGNIYYMSLTTEPKGVFVDGSEVKMAETDWIQITSRPIQTQVGALQATLDALDGVEAIEGAYIICKEWSFRPCYRRTVTDYTTGILTLDAAPNTDPTGAGVGMPFKLLNKKSYITEVGEWAYDSAAQRLYIMTSGASPSGTDIRISTRDYGVVLATGISNVTTKNIKFTHQYLEGVYSDENHNVVVTDCVFEDLLTNGASFTGDGTNITFSNNTLARISNNGVHIGGINGGTFNSNSFNDIGMQAGISFPKYSYFRSVGSGINMRWDDTATIWVPQNITAMYNTFDDMAYCGIVDVGIGNIVQYNVVDTYCMRWADGGGIYVSNVFGPTYGNGSDTTDGTVSNNLIINGQGGPLTLAGITGGQKSINGLYIDNNCSSITAEYNYIENIESFGFMSNVSNQGHIVRHNTIVDALVGARFNKWEAADPMITLYPDSNGHTFENNIIASRTASQIGMYLNSVDDDDYNPFAVGGSCDFNKYINPYRTEVVTTNFSGAAVNRSLSSWQGVFTLDQNVTSFFATGEAPLFVDNARADIDILSGTNRTGSETTLDTSTYSYYDEDKALVTSLAIPAYSGRVAIRRYGANGSVVVEDTYTGGAGNLTGHTPDIGPSWTINTGTLALDGSGYLTASVAGIILQTAASGDVTVETTGQVSATGGIQVFLRFASAASYLAARLFINPSDSGQNEVQLLNNGSVFTKVEMGTSVAINTDYRIKARIVGGSVAIWLNDTLLIELLDDATIAAKNPLVTTHGLSVPTTSKHTKTNIWEIASV